MIIILPLGQTVKEYKWWVQEKSKGLVLKCPGCGHNRVHRHSRYSRQVVSRFILHTITIIRWRCPSCGLTISVLPDLLIPYGRFLNRLREKAARDVSNGVSISEAAERISSTAVSVVSVRTIQRWVKRMRGLAGEMAGWLVRQLWLTNPHLDPYAISKRESGAMGGMRFLLDIGDLWLAGVREKRGHIGLFAAVARSRAAPGQL